MMKIRKKMFTVLELLIAMALGIVIISGVIYFYRQLTLINIKMDTTQSEQFELRYAEYRLNHILPNVPSPSHPDFHFFTPPNNLGLFKQGSDNLLFTFDNGVQLDKSMSYLVIGRLYLDRKGRFTLATWPSPKYWIENEPPPIHKEVLMENVESLSFNFYVPPDKGPVQVSVPQAGPENADPSQEGMGQTPSPSFSQRLRSQPPGALPPPQTSLTGEAPVSTLFKAPDLPPEIRDGTPRVWPKEYHQLPAIVEVLIQRKNGNTTFAFPLPKTIQPIIVSQ